MLQPITSDLATFLREGNLTLDVWTGCSNPSAEMERDLQNYNEWQETVQNSGLYRLSDDAGAKLSTLNNGVVRGYSLSSEVQRNISSVLALMF